jgi:hypothetical protein
MNIDIKLPEHLELAATTVTANGAVVTLEDLFEANSDYFDTPIPAMTLLSDLLISGESMIGCGPGSIQIALVAWGECPCPL